LFRLVHVNYLHRDDADYWRNEVLISWWYIKLEMKTNSGYFY